MADDYTNNTSTRGILRPGAQATGAFEAANDVDWFKISLTAGKFYTIELTSTAALTYYQALGFYDSNGGYLTSSSGGNGSTFKYTVKAPTTGEFYVGVADQTYSGNFLASSYTLKVSAAITDDIGDTRATARALALDTKSAAVLEGSSDIDYFKIVAEAGVTYTITPAWNPNGTNSAYGSVRVENADGTYVPSAGLSAGQSFTATRTGDYYIAVSNASGPVTNYSINVTKAADDHAANKEGAGQLTVGAVATPGVINVSGDIDWYGVQLAAETVYWFTLAGSTYPGYSGNGVLRLIAEDGTVVATSPGNYIDSTSSVLLEYVPKAAGKYYLEVSGNTYSTGNYAVNAVVGEKDDHADGQATATSITPGTTVEGKLAIPLDMDMFKLAVTAGKTYLVALTARTLGSGTELALGGQPASYPTNNSLAEYAKAGVAEYRVLTVDTTGDYFFTVNGGYGRGTGSYALAVTEAPADDHAAEQSTTSVLNVGSRIGGVLDYTGDIDTFKVTLQYGAKYAFQLRGAGSGEGTLAAGRMQLQVSSTEPNSYVNLTDNRDGTYSLATTTGGDYYVSVRPQSYYYGSEPVDLTGSYTVHAVALNGDTVAPTLASYTPAANAGPLDSITLRFSEAIIRGNGAGNETIMLRDSLGVTLETYYRDDSRITIAGDTLTINPSMQLKPGTKYLLSVPSGAVTDLAGNKFVGSQLLPIDTVGTVNAGGPGNDYLVGLGNGARLSGAGGVDTVIYGYDRSEYDVVRATAGTTVSKKNWDGSTGSADMLDGVERLMFANVNVALDIDGVAGQAYRLYQAAFDRAPDKPGIGFWIGQLDNGLPLQAVARGFLNSNEFATLYGSAPTDSVFVTKLYENILHRTPDSAGVDYWLDILGQGAERANVLVAFSEGFENQAATLQVIGNGFEYTPYG